MPLKNTCLSLVILGFDAWVPTHGEWEREAGLCQKLWRNFKDVRGLSATGRRGWARAKRSPNGKSQIAGLSVAQAARVFLIAFRSSPATMLSSSRKTIASVNQVASIGLQQVVKDPSTLATFVHQAVGA